MRTKSSRAMRWGLALLMAATATGAALSQTAPAGGPPPGFAAPAEPRPDENNAQRGVSQPGNNAPFWRAVRNSGEQAGYTSLPGAEKGVLIQSFTQYPGSRFTTAGEAWRQVRNQWILPYGGSLLLITLLAVAIAYWRLGPLGGHIPDTGRKIQRFTPFERAAHMTNAAAFVVLAVSGIVTAFGKFLLLPIIGGTLFGWLSYVLKTLHNFVGPLFVVSLAIVIVTFVRDNLPSKGDLDWLKSFGGMAGGKYVPAPRFNAGEKLVFWAGVLVLGVTAAVSGLILDMLFPGLEFTRGQMQVANMVHAVSAVLMMSLFVGHIYLGTIGTKGAWQGMRTGQVDEAWAKEHHELWYNDVKAGRVSTQDAGAAAPGARGEPART